jgi:hypothetical protein
LDTQGIDREYLAKKLLSNIMEGTMDRLNYLLKNSVSLGLLCVFILILPAKGLADTIIYGANAYGNTDMVEINLTQGTSQIVGNVAFGTQAIAQDPETGYVYYFEWTDLSDEFAYWNPSNGANTIVRKYIPPLGIYPKRLAFAPDGTLYGMDKLDRIAKIDKLTGVITLLGKVTGLETGELYGTGDFAFAPDGTLYVVTYQSLYTIDLESLEATLLYSGLIEAEGVLVWSGLAYCDGLLYASDIESSDFDPNNAASLIYSIDPATGEVIELFYSQTFLNDLTSCPATLNSSPVLDPIGAKTVNEGELLEFTISASDPDAGDILTYSAENLPIGASFDPDSQIFSWMPALGDIGDHQVTFRVTDDGTPPRSDSEEVTISVNSSSPPDVIELRGENYTEDTAIGNNARSLLNYGGSPATFAVGSYGLIARSLIKWDVSSIPPGSKILSAQMSLYSYQNYIGESITIDAHRVLKPWIEGTLDDQDRQYDTPESSCWIEYGNGELWSKPGADGPNDRATAIISSETNGGTGWYSWDITEAVQKWVDGDWANDGLILKSHNETSNNLKMFAPSEYHDERFRPVLVVEYIQP